MTDKTWVVTLAPGCDVAAARRGLTEAGFEVQSVMDAIGVITGAASDAAADRARGVEGVADVAEDQAIDIGPPGGSHTW